MIQETLLKLIVTFGFIGQIKKAPGTLGSLAAFPTLFIIDYVVKNSKILSIVSKNLFAKTAPEVVYIYLLLFVTFILFLIGWKASSIYIKKYTNNTDPSEIVIDEVVGQMLTCILCIFGYLMLQVHFLKNNLDFLSLEFKALKLIVTFALPFGLFRLFDIWKPWPINYIDKRMKNALGLMLDDLLAGVFAAVTFYLILFSFI